MVLVAWSSRRGDRLSDNMVHANLQNLTWQWLYLLFLFGYCNMDVTAPCLRSKNWMLSSDELWELSAGGFIARR